MKNEFTHQDILEFIGAFWGDSWQGRIDENDVFDSLSIFGDDAKEFMLAYSDRFNVDLENYRWYFHTQEEGHNLGALFFKPPYLRVEKIPISTALLLESAKAGRWVLEYPPHELPARRRDMHINQALAGLSLVALLFWLISKLL